MNNLHESLSSKSSQLAEPLWTDSGIKSGINVREQISTSEKQNKNTTKPKERKKKKKKSAGGEWMMEHSPSILSSEDKATSTVRLKVQYII